MARFIEVMDLDEWQAQERRRRRNRRQRREAGRESGPGKPRRSADKAPSRRDLVPVTPLREARQKPPTRRAALRGEEEDLEPHEAELDDQELEPEDLGEEPARERRGLGQRVRDAVTRDWQKPVDLGERMRVQTRAGTRAAVVEVKPGLFVVAEVPAESVEFGLGPMLLAPALIKTLGRALQGRRSAGGAGRAHRPELSTQPQPKQLPGPTADEPEVSGLAPWLDQDIAAELGCPCELPKRRTP